MCTHVHNEYIMKHVKTKSLLLLERIPRRGGRRRRRKKQQLNSQRARTHIVCFCKRDKFIIKIWLVCDCAIELPLPKDLIANAHANFSFGLARDNRALVWFNKVNLKIQRPEMRRGEPDMVPKCGNKGEMHHMLWYWRGSFGVFSRFADQIYPNFVHFYLSFEQWSERRYSWNWSVRAAVVFDNFVFVSFCAL